jgi:hypothetical protein
MKTIVVLITMLLLLFNSIVTRSEECYSLVDIIIESKKNGGIIIPLTRDNISILINTNSISSDVIHYGGDFYLEHRNTSVVRIFNMKNDCADHEWFMPTYQIKNLIMKQL